MGVTEAFSTDQWLSWTTYIITKNCDCLVIIAQQSKHWAVQTRVTGDLTYSGYQLFTYSPQIVILLVFYHVFVILLVFYHVFVILFGLACRLRVIFG